MHTPSVGSFNVALSKAASLFDIFIDSILATHSRYFLQRHDVRLFCTAYEACRNLSPMPYISNSRALLRTQQLRYSIIVSLQYTSFRMF